MLVRQSKNTFIRHHDDEGYVYIVNQRLRHDRIYNETGADFLKEISRKPQEIEEIISRLKRLYGDSVPFDELRMDFMDFVEDLAKHQFLVLGESVPELDKNDVDFSYGIDSPKTVVDDFSQETEQQVKERTQDFNLEHAQKKPILSGIQIEITGRCNERCIHCYIPNAMKDVGKDMRLEEFQSIVDQFTEMGGLHVVLSGGEVFLNKDIIPMIQYCREKDMQISILSNLIALKKEQIPAIKEANLSVLQTSLYSMDPNIHDTITTIKGSFAKTKAAIEALVAADIPVQISCPIMKANCKGYAEVLQYAHSLKCKVQTDFIMMAQSNFDTQNLANRISLEETESLLRDIIEWDLDYHTDIAKKQIEIADYVADKDRFAKRPLCGAGLNDCCIDANGDIYPCAGWQSFVAGNVFKTSLKKVWESSQQLKSVRAVTRADFPECLECEASNYCAMCLVRNYNESNGDMLKINKHFCDVAFLNKKIVEEYNIAQLVKKEGFDKPRVFVLKGSSSNLALPQKIEALGVGYTQTQGMIDDEWFWYYDVNSRTYHQKLIENFYEEEAENL